MAVKTKATGTNGTAPHPDTPYSIGFQVRGTRSFFFNRYDVDEFFELDAAPKGSKLRRDKDPMRLVWRADDGTLAVQSLDFLKAMREAGRYMPDVTATGRKSAMPEVPRALVPVEELCSFGVDDVDAIDVRPVKMRSGSKVPKARPILTPGWETSVHFEVMLPEFFWPSRVVELMVRAGRVLGIGDGTTIGYGRFLVVNVEAPREIEWATPEFGV